MEEDKRINEENEIKSKYDMIFKDLFGYEDVFRSGRLTIEQAMRDTD